MQTKLNLLPLKREVLSPQSKSRTFTVYISVVPSSLHYIMKSRPSMCYATKVAWQDYSAEN